MERLTYRNKDGFAYLEPGETNADAIEKLAKYEDMDEADLLMKLPHTVGTVTYRSVEEVLEDLRRLR